MFGIVQKVEGRIVWLESCGLAGGLVPFIAADDAAAAQLEPGMRVSYQESKRAMNVVKDSMSFVALQNLDITAERLADAIERKVPQDDGK